MTDAELEYRHRVRATLHDLIERRRSSKSVASLAKTSNRDKLGTQSNSSGDNDEEEEEEDEEPMRDDMRMTAKIRPCLSLFIHSSIFTTFIFVIIIINTALLVLQTFESIAVRADWYFTIIDSVFLGIYVSECVLKLFVLRLDYFRDYWNLLDLVIVLINILDFILPFLINSSSAGKFVAFDILRMFRIFKAIRALRVLRAIRFMTNLQVIMNTCIQSMHSMGAIVGLMLLFMYMFAVIGRGMYSHADPKRFGTLWVSLFTLFQLLTLDDWFFIYEDVVRADPNSGHVIVYLISYIVIEFLIFLNLFVAVLVDNFQLTLYAAHINESDKQDPADVDGSISDMSLDDATAARDRDSKRMSIHEAYPDASRLELETLTRMHQIMAAIEYNMSLYQQQQATLNAIVDLCNDETEAQ